MQNEKEKVNIQRDKKKLNKNIIPRREINPKLVKKIIKTNS